MPDVYHAMPAGMTGPSPVDRGKSGSKLHVLSDRAGIRWPWPFRRQIPTMPKRCGRWCERFRRCGPDVVRAVVDRRSCTPTRHMTIPNCVGGSATAASSSVSLAGAESSDRLGRHRWVIERTISWLTGCHRLNIRYDRKATLPGLLTLAAALTGYKKLAKAKPAT